MPMEANQTPTANCTVFIVDDDPAARESVTALVGSHDVPTQAFSSAAEFLASYEPSQRGCLVVDVRMTGMTGLELQQELSVRGYRIPVIVITGFADVPTAVRAMRAGAVTFLEKPCSDKELWASIETALQWEARSRQQRNQREEIQARRATLTPAEVQVLVRLIAGKANKAIAAELDLGLRTVELRRATIMKKMEANSLAELVRLILSIEGPSDAAVPAAD
jgi:two-component system response regulator FixJ